MIVVLVSSKIVVVRYMVTKKFKKFKKNVKESGSAGIMHERFFSTDIYRSVVFGVCRKLFLMKIPLHIIMEKNQSCRQ